MSPRSAQIQIEGFFNPQHNNIVGLAQSVFRDLMVRRIDTSFPTIFGSWVVVSRATLAFFSVDILSIGSTLDRIVIPKQPTFAKLRKEKLCDVDKGAWL
jgi:hypothetical protein